MDSAVWYFNQYFKGTKLKKIFLVLFLTLPVACSKKKTPPQSELVTQENQDRIYSSRPQNTKQVILMLKLKSPPLLKTRGMGTDKSDQANQKVDPKGPVSQELAREIQKEQNELITALLKISPEIRVLFRYRLVLNAVSVIVPVTALPEIEALPGILDRENSQIFGRPIEISPLSRRSAHGETLGSLNSVSFIGAEEAHGRGVKGKGQKVGIIDTGIDYTHAMFGGVGTVEAYKSVNPEKPSEFFPNQRVVGGMDFVGTQFNGASEIFSERIPHPDLNPMDEAGHGTHVAGTVGGLGDGVNSYTGVAPESSLYALKVFGSRGSTTDEVVIGALEWAADPNGDLDLADQLDVVNLSLGSEYGTPHVMYAEAVENLSLGGTVVVASAGNSGSQQYIVGSPSVTEEAISVAASVDGMDHNWKFSAVKFEFEKEEPVLAEAVEGPASKKIDEAGDVKGEIIYVGSGNEELSPEIAQRVKGHVALMDRGVKPFVDKLRNAEKAGAIGAIVANNQDGPSFSMGLGDGVPVGIPAIMITLDLGKKIKEKIQQNEKVNIAFQTKERISKPELVDTIAGFSSQGPRLEDALIKPEISAPGQNIISAGMGMGKEAVALSGTSMAAPHIAGVIALLKQSHPNLSSRELKSLLMGTAKSIRDPDQQIYPVSMMGAGRVQVVQANSAQLLSSTTGISLGPVRLEGQKILRKKIELKNISQENLKVKLSYEGSPEIKILGVESEIKPGETVVIPLDITLSAQNVKTSSKEVSGILKFVSPQKEQEREVFRIPILAMLNLVSQVSVADFVVHSTSALDASGSAVDLVLKNNSSQPGQALLMNLIGTDARKASTDKTVSKSCDLQSVGYRISQGKLQMFFKLYNFVSVWHLCELSVLIDSNGDGQADQELAGVPLERLPGVQGREFKTLLLDANVARQIRKSYEEKLEKLEPGAKERPQVPDYSTALMDMGNMKYYNSSSVAMLEIKTESLKLKPTGEFSVKISTSSMEERNAEPDDFLGDPGRWIPLDIHPQAQSYLDLPEQVTVQGNSKLKLSFEKGEGASPLMVLYPQNKSVIEVREGDEQVELAQPKYSR